MADPWADFNPQAAPAIQLHNDPWADFAPQAAPTELEQEHDANVATGSSIPDWLLALTPDSVKPAVREGLGSVVNDVTAAPGAIYHGATRAVGRLLHDVTTPEDAVADAKALGQGVVNAASNPGATADAVLRSGAEHPGYALLNGLAVGGVPTLGQGMLGLGTKTLKGVDAASVRPLMSLIGGTSGEAQRLAQVYGEAGGDQGAAFLANMKKPDYAAMQAMGQKGISQWKAARDAAYEANKNIWGNDPTQLQYSPVVQAITDARNSLLGPNGYEIDPEAHGVIKQMAHEVLKHQQQMAGTPNALGARSMDALKQNLGVIMRGQEEGSNARRVASDIYGALRDEIANNVDSYDEGMVDYNTQRKDINEAVKSLSLGERAGRSTTAGKLLSALRTDDSRGIFGARAGDLEAVSRFQPNLPAAVAGATFNPMMPRGIIAKLFAAENLPEVLPKLAEPAAGAYAALALPGMLKGAAGLALAIPRLQGRLRYGIGAATRGARAIGATQKNLGLLGQGALYGNQNPDSEDDQ